MNDTNVAAAPAGSFALSDVLRMSDGLLDLLPVGIATCDHEGRLVRYNRRAAELWGHAPELGARTVRFCGAVKHYQPDGAPIRRDDLPAAQVLRTRTKLRDKDIVFERPDGSRVWVSANADPLLGENGAMIGVVICFTDITAVKLKQQEREQNIHQLLDVLPVALYTTDAEGRITFYNQAAAEFWGRRPELHSEQWCGSLRLFHPGGIPLPHEDCTMAVSLKHGMPVRGAEAIAERPDGTRVPFSPFPTPLRDSEGRVIGAVNLLIDISERKRSQERRHALISVLNHRVKNTLATVQALASQTIRGRGIKREVRTKFVGRLFALSRAHDLLTREGWDSADLQSVMQEVLAPHHGRIELRGTTMRISPKTALALSMVLHELAANAVHHGALSARTGSVALAWTLKPDEGGATIILSWRESGGPPVAEPARRGFGLRLVERSIVQELRGVADIAFEPTGVTCTLSFPIAAGDMEAGLQPAAGAEESVSAGA